jgi:hypothetical protein
MEPTGLIAKIIDSVADIDQGRQWLDTEGFEAVGRVSCKGGIASAIEALQESMQNAAKDLRIFLLCEKVFLSQELRFCPPHYKEIVADLTKAIDGLDDALLALEAVERGSAYEIAEMTHPRNTKYRVKGMPKDSFHVFCGSHRVRIDDYLRTPRLNTHEKELFAQRRSNLAAAKAAYLVKQKAALADASRQTTS